MITLKCDNGPSCQQQIDVETVIQPAKHGNGSMVLANFGVRRMAKEGWRVTVAGRTFCPNCVRDEVTEAAAPERDQLPDEEEDPADE